MKNVLKNLIVEKIKGNSNQEITGQSLQDVLLSIVDSVYGDLEISMEGYSFEGIATVTTIPPALISDSDKRFYLAVDDGLYSNFTGLQSTPIVELSILRNTARNYWEAISLKIPLNFSIKNELGASQKDPISQKKVTELYNQGYKYAGIAHPVDSPNPLTGEEKIFMLVTEKGDYANYGLGTISELSVIKSLSGSWVAESIKFNNYKITRNSYIDGDNGQMKSNTGTFVAEFNVSDYQTIEFAGLTARSSTSDIGYAIYDDNGNALNYSVYSLLESDTMHDKNYVIDVSNASILRITHNDLSRVQFKSVSDIDINSFLNNTIAYNIVYKASGKLYSDSYITKNKYSLYKIRVTQGLFLQVKPSVLSEIAISLRDDNDLEYLRLTASADTALYYPLYVKKDGFLYVTSETPPVIKIVGRGDYNIYHTERLLVQGAGNIMPKIGSAYKSGSIMGLTSAQNRCHIRLFLEKSSSLSLKLVSPVDLQQASYVGVVNGNFINSRPTLSGSWSSVINITNNDNDEVYFTFKKSDDSDFTEEELASISVVITSAEISDTDAKNTFMEQVNSYAVNYGMENSIFYNPTGGIHWGVNQVTAKDMLMMSIKVWSDCRARRFMSTDTAILNIKGSNAGARTVTNDVHSSIKTYYKEMYGSDMPFIYLGSKAGGWSSGDAEAYSLVAFYEIEGKTICCVTATNDTDKYNGTTGRQARVRANVELAAIVEKILKNESIENYDVTYCEKAIAGVYDVNLSNVKILWEKNANDVYNPGSTTKILSLQVMLDNLNLGEWHEIRGEELNNDSDYTAYEGDIETVGDSMYAMMLASNGTNTMSLMYLTGRKMQETFKKI